MKIYIARKSRKNDTSGMTAVQRYEEDKHFFICEELDGIWKRYPKNTYEIVGECGESCICGKCTGEDRALELMEKGIVEAENRFGDK